MRLPKEGMFQKSALVSNVICKWDLSANIFP